MRSVTVTYLGQGISEVISHFWGVAGPFFNSTIWIVPHEREDGIESHPAEESAELQVFDPDGALVSTTKVEFPRGEIGVVELEPIFAACKVTDGMRHGHVVVKSPGEYRHECRFRGTGGTWMSPELLAIRPREASFVPLTLSNLREQILIAVNCQPEPAQCTCRLYYGTRTPEVTVSIPASGVRIVDIERTFLEEQEMRLPPNEQLQAYLRVSSKQTGLIGVAVVERSMGEAGEGEVYRQLA